MKTPFTIILVFSLSLLFSQSPIDQLLRDSAITWAAVSEIKIDLQDNRLIAEQLIGDQFNCVRSLKTDIQQYPQWSADKFLSHWLVEQINQGKLPLQSLESGYALDLKQLQKELIQNDTIINDAGNQVPHYRHLVQEQELFTYFVLKQLWYYNEQTTTLHNQFLGIIPVYVHPKYPGDEQPRHQQLGWIPFTNTTGLLPAINDADLPWIKVVTSCSAFSDWEIIKGNTSVFIKEYFFTAAQQNRINITVPGQDGIRHPSSDKAYFYAESGYKASVLYGIVSSRENVDLHLSASTPERISEVIGMTFDQYIYLNAATGQLLSYLDLVGPLARGYLDEGYSEYTWQDYFYAPIYYILRPSESKK